MDAYDIFKKLSKGLKFNTRVIGVKPKDESSVTKILKEEPVEVKEEIPSDNDDAGDSDASSQSGAEEESESEEGSEKEDLQIMDGVAIGVKKERSKKKKEKSEDLKKKLELEEQNRFRNEYGIKAVGRHIPPALKDFAELSTKYNVSEATVNIVQKCGYTEPTPIQRQALPCMLEGRQVFACAPTGSGKTAAFLLPVIHNLGAAQGGPRALILCPTRELAVQIYGEALRLSEGTELRCSLVRKMQESKIKERESTIKKSDIVISTPNRLCYLLNQDNVNIKLDKVRWLIVDEADKLFEGKEGQDADFRQQLEQIMSACDSRERRVAMFSATHTAAAARWGRRQLRGLITITVGHRNTATSLVEQELLFCGNEGGKIIAFRQLVQKGLNPPVLVFVQSKDRAKQLFKELIYDGINVDVIHADRTQAQRDNVVRSFRTGRIWVLVCTELMGRGIDFRGVNLVVNYDFPPSAISYIHRVGRAGRAGQKGKAITFFTQDDVVNLRSIASVMKQSGCDVPDYMLKLKKDQNAAKRLQKKAPKRDKISTILEKTQKRKLEDDKVSSKDEATATKQVKNAKNNKQRKLNSDTKLDKNKQNNSRPQQKKVNSKKIKKQEKKDLKKKQKKPFAHKKSKRNVA